MHPLIYIAGPYRAENAWEVERNIRRAEELAHRVWALGGVAVCPHTMNRFFSGAVPDDAVLPGMLALLKHCDALAVVENWERSSGTRAEIETATEDHLPVFYHHAQFDDITRAVRVDEIEHIEQWCQQFTNTRLPFQKA